MKMSKSVGSLRKKYGLPDGPSSIENPLMVGDFVRFVTHGKKQKEITSYGIVSVSNSKYHLNFIHFEEGLPEEISGTYDKDRFKLAQKDQAINHFEELRKNWRGEFKKGGVKGALASRMEFYLTHLIESLNDYSPLAAVEKANDYDPRTGSHIVRGVYDEHFKGDELAVVVNDHELREVTLKHLLTDIARFGFGAIKSERRESEQRPYETESLTGYDVFGVPEEAVPLVKSPTPLDDIHPIHLDDILNNRRKSFELLDLS